MELKTFLQANRETILREWFGLVIKSYPRDTSAFLEKQKDPFRNPVGHAISEGIKSILDYVLSGGGADRLPDALDQIVRIRSVQDFTASQAVAFVFDLKAVLSKTLNDGGAAFEQSWGLKEIATRVDRVALMAFDKYMQCREDLHEVRAREIRNASMRLMSTIREAPGGGTNESR